MNEDQAFRKQDEERAHKRLECAVSSPHIRNVSDAIHEILLRPLDGSEEFVLGIQVHASGRRPPNRLINSRAELHINFPEIR